MPKNFQMSDQFGNPHNVTELDVVKVIQGKTILELADGTILAMNVLPLQVLRIDKQWDQAGLPLYNTSNKVISQISECDEALKTTN